MANFELSVQDMVTVTCQPTNKEGQAVPDQITWASDNDNLVLGPSDDTLSCNLVPSDIPTANVTITASDAEGNTVTAVIDTVDTVPAAFSLAFGTPVPKA